MSIMSIHGINLYSIWKLVYGSINQRLIGGFSKSRSKKKKGGINMELLAIKCANCNKEIYVLKNYIREKMFCTLRCMDAYSYNQVSSIRE